MYANMNLNSCKQNEYNIKIRIKTKCLKYEHLIIWYCWLIPTFMLIALNYSLGTQLLTGTNKLRQKFIKKKKKIWKFPTFDIFNQMRCSFKIKLLVRTCLFWITFYGVIEVVVLFSKAFFNDHESCLAFILFYCMTFV